MRYVAKGEAPAELLHNRWDTLKARALTEGAAHEAKSACYRATTIEQLDELYHGKCAYCERSRGEELQVDHYRPKKARTEGDVAQRHSGYYWLTYEWTNLIPLCSSCNVKKGTIFPVRGQRVTSHNHAQAYNLADLQALEQPLLIHPELDENPERHFIYRPNGEVEGRTLEGQAVVEYCKLNSRTKCGDRLAVIQGYRNRIIRAVGRYVQEMERANFSREILVAELRGELIGVFEDIGNGTHWRRPLSLLHQFIWTYFEHFMPAELELAHRDLVLSAFRRFKEEP